MREQLVLPTLFGLFISGLGRPEVLPTNERNHRISLIPGIRQHFLHQQHHQFLPFIRITCHQSLMKQHLRRLLRFLLKLQLEQFLIQFAGQQFFEIAHVELLLLSVNQSKRLALPMINLIAFLHNIHVENVINIHQIMIQLKLFAYMCDFFLLHGSSNIS
ncbi:hypothetical protein D3C76_729800 [compost metagenome]